MLTDGKSTQPFEPFQEADNLKIKYGVEIISVGMSLEGGAYLSELQEVASHDLVYQLDNPQALQEIGAMLRKVLFP